MIRRFLIWLSNAGWEWWIIALAALLWAWKRFR